VLPFHVLQDVARVHGQVGTGRTVSAEESRHLAPRHPAAPDSVFRPIQLDSLRTGGSQIIIDTKGQNISNL
jgi:hypothetical protein